MLAVTDRAADLIKQAVEANELPEGAGVRIAPHGAGAEGSTAFAASLADSPEGDDNVVEVEGARVFLDPGVSSEFDDKVLDAQVEPDGAVTLGITQQDGYAETAD